MHFSPVPSRESVDVDGLASVTSRIADIEGRISALRGMHRAPAVAAASGAAPFASALADAVAQQSTKVRPGSTIVQTSAAGATAAAGAPFASPTGPRAPAHAGGGLTADGVPRELAAYGNGRIPASALTPIGRGSHRMWDPAAEAFARLEKAAARDGVSFKVTDSYRSYEAQVDVARRKGLYSEGGLAAKPGTSDHGWGRSLDLDLSGKALSWMRANGDKFGFREDVPREPWHWTYYPS
jgi:D-alanyl-D-alanine carboxypeptidase